MREREGGVRQSKVCEREREGHRADHGGRVRERERVVGQIKEGERERGREGEEGREGEDVGILIDHN